MRVVITGAGSGFGHGLALRLLGRGDVVVAIDREPEGLAMLAARGASTFVADVRDAAAIAAVAGVLGSEVDGVVNNAGYAVFGSQAEADLDAVREMFETNVLGPAIVARAFLPALRATRGVIVQISSVAGRVVLPESGFYAASKHAVEAMSEALYFENLAFGVGVAVIEPGAFATGFSARAGRHSRPRDPASPYAPVFAAWDGVRGELIVSDQDPTRVVDALADALDGPRGFRRVPVGVDAERRLAERAEVGDAAWMEAMRAACGG